MEIQDIMNLETHSKPILKCGIYFLMRDDEIVYVGQSVNIESRIITHFNEGVKDFNGYKYFECEREDLTKIEARLIKELDPEYNATMPPGQGYYSVVQWASFFRISRNLIKSFMEMTDRVPVRKWYSPDDMEPFKQFMLKSYGRRWEGIRARTDSQAFAKNIAAFRRKENSI